MSGGDSRFDFSCNVTHVDTIPTPNLVTDAQAAQLIASGQITGLKKFQRNFFGSGKSIMPDGVEIRHWGFDDGTDSKPLPSPQIRLTEGDIAQVTLTTGKKVHTIHHHGIEPDPFNDGVGHTSFETSGTYTYQFRATEAGSYWYHCHVNTILHVQMGLFGTLVVDPYPVTNPKKVFRGGPEYVHERYWVPYSIDPRWHTLDHAAGLCGEDVGLNRFEPKYFGISGKFQTFGNDPVAVFDPATPPITDPSVAITAKSGEPILIRLLNGQYFPIELEFGGPPPAPPLLVEAVSSDGRALLDTANYSGRRGTASPLALALKDSFPAITPAERYDLILNSAARPVTPGVYGVTVRFLHWISGDQVGVARTRITIT
jgi:FtsP/CotA-like multicopper oxidase with cupredoxin domain